MRTLTADQAEILDGLVETMIPSDGLGPGAREAQVARFVDAALALAEHRESFVAGLEATNDYAESSFGVRFVDLDPDRMATILSDVEMNRATGFGGGSAAFFAVLRMLVFEGMFCDPCYGGNADYIGWKLIGYPGHKLVVRPEEQQLDAVVEPIYQRTGRGDRDDAGRVGSSTRARG